MRDLTQATTCKIRRVFSPPQRVDYMDGRTYRFTLPNQQHAYYVTINAIDGSPKEIFINSANQTEDMALISRSMSIALRSGVSVETVIQGFLSSNVDVFSKSGEMETLHALTSKLKELLTGGDKTREFCKKCGGEIVKNSGCSECLSCGEQKCEL